MNKFDIKVIIPLLNKTYELFIPNNILVGNLLYMLINSINELNKIDIGNVLLYDSLSGNKLELDEYVFKNINNGSILIMV